MGLFKIIPEVHLILERDDQFLLLRRYNTGYEDGKYSLVAGHVDGGETFAAAMAREAWEEAGLQLAGSQLELVHTMHRLSDTERLSLFFRASDWQGEPRNVEPHKCDDLSWFKRQALPDNMVPYIRAALRHYDQGKPYSEFGWTADA